MAYRGKPDQPGENLPMAPLGIQHGGKPAGLQELWRTDLQLNTSIGASGIRAVNPEVHASKADFRAPEAEDCSCKCATTGKGECGCNRGAAMTPKTKPAETRARRGGDIKRTHPRLIRRGGHRPMVPNALPEDKVYELFEAAVNSVATKPFMVKMTVPKVGFLNQFKVGGQGEAQMGGLGGGSLDVQFGPIIQAMVPEPEGIVIPGIVCNDIDIAQDLMVTYWNSARYMNYARVMLNLMWAESESKQEQLWTDKLTMDPNGTTRISRWFGSYTHYRLERLRNRVIDCYDKRFRGAAQVITLYCDYTYHHGACAGCALGAGAYHGDVYHVCFCNARRARDELYMIHEFFHHIPPAFVDTHDCGSNVVPEPWRWDVVGYDATYLDQSDGRGAFGGLYDGNNNRNKWDGAVADLISGCPEQALRNPDSYAHWINYIGRLVDDGASWPEKTVLRSHSPGGGGGDGPIDCSPDSLDGMCIQPLQEDEGF